MGLFSFIPDKVIDTTADIIVAIAIHVPFLMHALMASPSTEPVKPAEPVIMEASTSVPITSSNKLSVEDMAKWQKEHEALMAERCSGMCIPFDSGKFSESARSNVQGGGYVFVDPVTNTEIKMNLLRDVEHQSRNPSYELYVDGINVGGVGGQLVAQPSFSPDGRYFAFRGLFLSGAVSFNTVLYVVDIKAKKLSELSTCNMADSSVAKNNPFINVMSFVDSYTWESGNKINILQYTVATFPSGDDYRVTAKSIWAFDLNDLQKITRDRVLVRTLPEEG